MKVLQYGDKGLSIRSREAIIGANDSISAIKALKKFHKEHPKGQGIAAPQLGYNIRIILCRFKREKAVIMYNPAVVFQWGSRKSIEGCESAGGPRKKFLVKRPRFGIVEYYTEEYDYVRRILWYHKLRVFCHEVDHLDGICLPDKGGIAL